MGAVIGDRGGGEGGFFFFFLDAAMLLLNLPLAVSNLSSFSFPTNKCIINVVVDPCHEDRMTPQCAS